MKAELLGLLLCACCACGKDKSSDSGAATSASSKASSTVHAASPSSKSGSASKSASATSKAPTATDQRNNEADLNLVQEVRRVLLEESSLSIEAQNLTAVARDGVVTLKGVAASADEKERVEALVTKVPGVLRVDDQISVKPK